MGGGSLWLAIAITIVASSASSVGKALQKQATRNLPKFSLDEKILRQYALDRIWIAGVVSDVLGGILQVAAFALAPVSIIQPVSGIGLVGLALYSHFFQHEKLTRWEWGAVASATVGTLLLGAASGGGETTSDDRPSAIRMLFVLFLAGASIIYLGKWRQQRQRPRRGGLSDKAVAALYGLQAGGCFGLSAASCRTGFLMASHRWTWAFFGLLSSVSLSTSGFVLQTKGLKDGSTVVVCTCVAVSSMVLGVLIGILGLAESVSGTLGAITLRIVSWMLILLGVVMLASGTAGIRELAYLVSQKIPPQIWQKIPADVAVRLKSWTAHKGELPEVISETTADSNTHQTHQL